MKPKEHLCPICNHAAPNNETNPAFPFCSPRCKRIDLGNWLGETYRIAGERVRPLDSEDGEDWMS